MNCSDCKYWHKGEPQYTYGFCHRYPPQAGFTFSVKPGNWNQGGEATISRHPTATEYPNTHEADWCGEHKPMEGQADG